MNSLCIPRAMTYTTTADVSRVFNQLFEGNFVVRVDERDMTDSHGQEFKMFYIHFGEGNSYEMQVFKEKMDRDGVVHVMTGRGKWFWKVYLNISTKAEKPVRKGPRIMTEEDEKLFLQWKESKNKGAAAEPTFTPEEIKELVEACDSGFTEDELDELDDAYGATQVHAEEEELMAIADEMAKE